ncbi:MAG: cytochrome c biogenesis protein CcsA, partial [Dehalococcoidia bacterium]
MSTIGYITLFLALEVSLVSAAASLLGRTMGYRRLAEGARIGVFVVCGLLSIAVALLLYALFSHDFHLSYVADYSSRQTPPLYLLTSFYAGNEGSLLFWAWMLSIFATVTVRRPFSNSVLMPFTASVIMVSETFFLVLLVFLANPFAEASTLVADGRGLNPLLENIGMLLHPPTILAGYVAFSVPFALAVAALITGKLSDRWLSAVRRWVLISWLLLGVGNLIGAWWA